MHASKLTQIVEEAQTVNDQKLSELEEKFQVVPVLYSTV
jgi:kinesin family protein 11